MYLREGRPLRAELDGATGGGREIMFRMLGWRGGQFEFATQDVACDDEIHASATELLLEHARVSDEGER